MVGAAPDVDHHRKQVVRIVRIRAVVRGVSQLELKREDHAVHQLPHPAAMRDLLWFSEHIATASPATLTLRGEERNVGMKPPAPATVWMLTDQFSFSIQPSSLTSPKTQRQEKTSACTLYVNAYKMSGRQVDAAWLGVSRAGSDFAAPVVLLHILEALEVKAEHLRQLLDLHALLRLLEALANVAEELVVRI